MKWLPIVLCLSSMAFAQNVSLGNLERDLKRLVFGQDKAIDVLTSAIKLARAGLREPPRALVEGHEHGQEVLAQAQGALAEVRALAAPGGQID